MGFVPVMITRTVSELAELCGATLEGDGDRTVTGPATLSEATPEEISFLGNPLYEQELESTRAAAVVIGTDVRPARTDLVLLRCADPNRAFTRVVEAFQADEARVEPGVHDTAVLAADVELGQGVSIGAQSCLGAGAVLEDGVVLHPRVTVGAGARIGTGTVVHPGVVLYPKVRVGARCILHAGCVVGSDGFGFEPTADGWEKVPQCGTVEVGDDVEIGANSTIDRGRFGPTRILAGTKIDNLVHIAHNVQVGPEALLIAQVGIAGSTRIGRRTVLAGQVGVVGHLEVGDGARVAAQSGISKSLAGGKDYFGSPAREKSEAYRIEAVTHKLPELARRVRALERRLDERLEQEEGS